MNYESEAFRDDTKLEGRFTNYFKVNHNNFEFVLDIDQFYPENEHAQLHTRIVTSPTHAKAMLETIQKDPSSSMNGRLEPSPRIMRKAPGIESHNNSLEHLLEKVWRIDLQTRLQRQRKISLERRTHHE